MIIKDHTRIDLAQGGTRFKQGDFVELAFTPRDAAGKVVDLTGKDIEVSIWNRSKGVIYQGAASFDSAEKLIRVTIKETLDHGKFQIEFTVTDSTDAEYRRKFPSDEYNGVINITPSTDNMDVVGVQMMTVEKFRAEFDQALNALPVDSEINLARVATDGTVYPNLPARLTAEQQDTATQLAETVKKQEPASISWGMADQNFREQITDGNTAVVGIDSVLPENIVTGALIPEKTNYIEVDPRNLYNYETNKDGVRLSNTGGEIADPTFSTSVFMKVKAGTYRVGFPEAEKPYSTSRLPFHDTDKAFVSLLSSGNAFTGVANSFDITAPSDGFIKVSPSIANKAQLVVARVEHYDTLSYQSYKHIMADKVVTKPKPDSVGAEELRKNSVAVENARYLTRSKNLFDKTAVQLDTLYSNYQQTSVAAGYFSTEEAIYIEPGFITINKVRVYAVTDLRGNGKQFVNTGDNNAKITLEITEPSLLSISGHSSNLGVTQIEYGTAETEYEANKIFFNKLSFTQEQRAELQNATGGAVDGDLTVEKTGNSYLLRSDFGEGTDGISILTERYGSSNGTYKLVDAAVNNDIFHVTGDDITPVRLGAVAVGANHGHTSIVVITIAGHGKTSADLGSLWTDGVTQYTLLKIEGDKLIFGCPYTVTDGVTVTAYVAPVADLTHVSGATNTSNVAIAGHTTGQLYPSVSNVSVDYFIGGKKIEADGEHTGDELQVVEAYDVLDYKDIIDFARNNIGISYASAGLTGALKLANTFTYRKGLKCTTSHSMEILKKVSLGNCGFIQAGPVSLAGHTRKRFMPYVLPKSGFDFTSGVDLDAYSTSLNFGDADLVDPQLPPTHAIDWLYDGSNNRKIGFTLGYIPDKTNSKNADRLANASTYWDMRGTKKLYPIALGGIVAEVGDYFNFETFRNYLAPDEVGQAINLNIVKDNKDTYLFADAVATTGTLSKELPTDIGKELTNLQSIGLTLQNETVDARGIALKSTGNGSAIVKVS